MDPRLDRTEAEVRALVRAETLARRALARRAPLHGGTGAGVQAKGQLAGRTPTWRALLHGGFGAQTQARLYGYSHQFRELW
jgi:hypothetical protein